MVPIICDPAGVGSTPPVFSAINMLSLRDMGIFYPLPLFLQCHIIYYSCYKAYHSSIISNMQHRPQLCYKCVNPMGYGDMLPVTPISSMSYHILFLLQGLSSIISNMLHRPQLCYKCVIPTGYGDILPVTLFL